VPLTPAPPQTPEEWLPILTRRLDYDTPRLRLLARYVDGDAPLPEMSRNMRASWQKFQRESRTNWAELVVESVADRIVPNGIEVSGQNNSPEASAAQQIWRNNRMDIVFKDAVRHMLQYGVGFLTGWVGEDEKAVITADSPHSTYAATDPLQTWRVRAAFKWWRDLDIQQDRAIVWVNGGYQLFWRSCYQTIAPRQKVYTMASGGWQPVDDFVETGRTPPVVLLQNPGQVGEFERHLDVINRINRGVLGRLVTAAMQAFRQRALRAAAGTAGLPEKDDLGNDIDWAKVFEPAPGALWDLPPGIDIWESQQTDIRPLLDGSMTDIRHLAAVTKTPVTVLIPDSANQTAEGATFAKEGLIFKCGDRITVATTGASAILLKALEIEGVEVDPSAPLRVLMKPPDMVSLTEKYTAAFQAKQAGESWASIARNILGYSPEQIAQDALDRAQEQLAAAAFAPAAPVKASGATPAA
jgi:hypothetical protein